MSFPLCLSALSASSALRLAVLATLTCGVELGFSAPLQFAGSPAELVVHEVSKLTVRITLAPLDQQGRPRPSSPSAVLVAFPQKEGFRAREVRSERNLRVGEMRITIKPQPLSVSVRRSDGKLVQELVFDANDGTNAIGFHTVGVSVKREA